VAVLKQLPHQDIISGFKGVIDFYLWKGKPCARKWPRHGKRTPYPEEAANQERFAYANRLWPTLPEAIRNVYIQMAVGTRWRGQDLWVRAYMKGLDY